MSIGFIILGIVTGFALVAVLLITWMDFTIAEERDSKPRRPLLTTEMRQAGLIWGRSGDQWIEVCDTCGGNCGQCGITDRVGNVPASFEAIIEPMRGKTPAGLRGLH